LLVGLQHGPFADNEADLEEFVDAVLAELAPVTAQERAEALNIAGLYVRRSRLVELEALALSHGTQARLLPPESSGGPPRIGEGELMREPAAGRTCDGERDVIGFSQRYLPLSRPRAGRHHRCPVPAALHDLLRRGPPVVR